MTDRLQLHVFEVFVNKCLRRILIYTDQTKDIITNKELWGKTGQKPVLDQTWRRKWNCLGYTLRRNNVSATKPALYSGTTRPQRQRTTKQYLEKISGERNMDSRIQVQLDEDGGGSTRQSLTGTSGLWPVFHMRATSHKSREANSYRGCS